MSDDHDALSTRLAAWRRHLRALVPPDADDGVAVVRTELVDRLLDDLARAESALESYDELAEVLRRTLSQWSGDVEALRAITRALDRVEREQKGERG